MDGGQSAKRKHKKNKKLRDGNEAPAAPTQVKAIKVHRLPLALNPICRALQQRHVHNVCEREVRDPSVPVGNILLCHVHRVTCGGLAGRDLVRRHFLHTA